MTAGGPGRFQSIFVHTLLLVMGVALAMTAVNVGLILLRPPPPLDPPLTAYEVARLLDGKPIAMPRSSLRLTRSAEPPAASRPGPAGEMVRSAIARFLGRPTAEVRFEELNFPSSPTRPASERRRALAVWRDRQIEAENRLYGQEGQFNPAVFGPFEAAVRQPDGSWRLVSREWRDPAQRWQSSMIILMAFFVLLMLPIVWLFSKRIARPIRAFAAAADRMGRHQQVDSLEVRGPAEIRLAAVAFNEMQARLERYVRERTSMIGAIAHDLRTPLSRLAFHLASTPEPARGRAEAEIAEMEGMIAGTLDFVENEARIEPHEPVELRLLVEGVVDDFADTGQRARLIDAEPVTVPGDPVMLKRLFSNLIRNAVTYGGAAEVFVRVEGRSAIVDVADSGPGLPAEDLTRVFEPFYRAEGSRNRSTGGMGLGLAIVRGAARAHGGKVELMNRPGGGLCARVTLPKS